MRLLIIIGIRHDVLRVQNIIIIRSKYHCSLCVIEIMLCHRNRRKHDGYRRSAKIYPFSIVKYYYILLTRRAGTLFQRKFHTIRQRRL